MPVNSARMNSTPEWTVPRREQYPRREQWSVVNSTPCEQYREIFQSEHARQSPRSVVSLFLWIANLRMDEQSFSFLLLVTKQLKEDKDYSGHFWILNLMIETRVNLIRCCTHKLIDEQTISVPSKNNLFSLLCLVE